MKLYLLQLGLMQPLGVPIPGYLVQTDDGTNVLVDSGLPHGLIGRTPEPTAPPGPALQYTEEDFVLNRLAAIGLRPDDVDLLVCTHFDRDHAGNHDRFPNAELVVQRRHYEVAKAGHPRFAVVRKHWDAPGLRYRLVDGDTTLLPGVELLETGGHVPGHQSVLVRLPETGPVILAIDAVPTSAMLDPDTRDIGLMDEDEAGTRASTRKLVDVARREGVTLIVHGHDPEQWPKLRHSPEFYT